jgi:hypothetical protein
MLKIQIPTFSGSISTPSAASGNYSITQIRKLQRALKDIDPKLRTELLREAKRPAKPVRESVIKGIQKVTPNSGLTRGRLNWNASVDAKGKTHKATDVRIQFRTASSGKSKETTLVRVRALSPAVVFADMAGKSGRFIDKGYQGTGRTREYQWRAPNGQIMKRTHAVNGQVEGIFKKLGRNASRFIWPAAEQSIPQARNEIDLVVQKYIDIANRKGI